MDTYLFRPSPGRIGGGAGSFLQKFNSTVNAVCKEEEGGGWGDAERDRETRGRPEEWGKEKEALSGVDPRFPARLLTNRVSHIASRCTGNFAFSILLCLRFRH